MQQRPRVFEYAVTLDGDWTVRSDRGGAPLPREEAWTPEHLLLAGLGRCLLTALEFHARRAEVAVGVTGVSAGGSVTRRDEDGRFAFVQIDVELDVTLDPEPEAFRELLTRAEHDCFVSASLALKPAYRWIVNGQAVT